MGWTCTRRPRWHYPASFGNQDISPRNHNTPGCTLGRSGQWYHGSYHPPLHWGLWQHEITPKPKQMDSYAKTWQEKEELGSASWRCPKQDRRHSPALLLICGFNILRMFLLGQIPKAPKFQSSERNWCYNGEKQKLPAWGSGHHSTLRPNRELSFLFDNNFSLKFQGVAQILSVLTDVQIARKPCSHLRHRNGIGLSQAIKTT